MIDDEIDEPLVPESTSQNLKTADTQIFTNQNPEKDEKFELQNLQRVNPIFKKRSSNKSNLDTAGRSKIHKLIQSRGSQDIFNFVL